MLKYKKYIFYDQIKYNQEPTPEEGHLTDQFPG